MAADCKSALLRVRWFESSPLHQCQLFERGSYSGNTLAFQAKARSSILLPRSIFNDGAVKIFEGKPGFSSCPFGSVVEHSLGKGEVAGPIPAMGTTDGIPAGVGMCMQVAHGAHGMFEPVTI